MVQRTVGRLKARQVSNAKPGLLADGGNLYLQTTFGNDGHARRSWVFRYEVDGRRREMGLGPLHTVGLADRPARKQDGTPLLDATGSPVVFPGARTLAEQCRNLVRQGIDPIEHRRKEIEANAVASAKNKTFAQVTAAYLKAHKDDWKNAKHAAQWQTSLTEETKAIANLPVAAIDTAHVLAVLEPIWRVKPESASRTRGRIERVIAYSIAAKYRKREDGNPARWDGHLEELLGSKSKAQEAKRERTSKSGHHATLAYKEAGQFMGELRRLTSLSAKALEFTILTAARTGETIGATWSEIDLTAKVWTTPGSRMKAGEEHRVPLCDRAIEILRALPRRGDRIFSLSNMAMLQCVRGLRPGLTVHGFRSTFMDWGHECTAFAKVVIDMALAHAVADEVEAAYRRGDLFEKRRQLMKAWDGYCAKPAPAGATVTPLRVAADA